jgi:hypothetical protein
MPAIVEFIRQKAVERLFKAASFNNAWPSWKPQILRHAGNPPTATNVIDLGDHLSGIFKSTARGRNQSSVSVGGAAWERLVCWYLNLCLIGSRTVVMKQHKDLLPEPIRDALTVNYGSFPSNTEADLVAITFPDHADFTTDIQQLAIQNGGRQIPTFVRRKFNYKEVINHLADIHFGDIEIGIIQCKTNWNDNAQIPMLWDIVYSAGQFTRRGISVGRATYTIVHLSRFSYSFVTVPTSSRMWSYTPNCTAVKRVTGLSGGNYWGLSTRPAVAASIKEIFLRVLNHGSSTNIRNDLRQGLSSLQTSYSYFNL